LVTLNLKQKFDFQYFGNSRSRVSRLGRMYSLARWPGMVASPGHWPRAHGGKALFPKTSNDGTYFVAELADSESNRVALHQPLQ
jgi:hypothetical protein